MKTSARLGIAVGATTLLCTSLVVQAAKGPDIARGKQLHNQSCLSCHNPSVYTRPNHKIRSLAALRRQVAGCRQAAGARWSPAERADVIDYLNQTFYHFGEGGGHHG